MRELQKDKLNGRIYDNRQQMGEAAAMAAAEAINETLRRKQYANVIFAAAPSQDDLLTSLAKQSVDWRRVNAFHMDEYAGLPSDAPQTFRHYLNEHIFRFVSPKSIYFIDGNTAVPEVECDRYARLLTEYPPDVVCLGIGENGHLAFNDPPANFDDDKLIKVVDLDEVCRQQQVNDKCFPSIELVPRQALSLTIPALMQGHYIVCVVPGPRKATAVYNTFNQAIDPNYPSTVLRRHPQAKLFLDKDSAGLL